MPTDRKMQVANGFMFTGIGILLVATVFSFCMAALGSGMSQASGGSVIVSMAAMLVGYVGMLVIGGVGAMWSLHLSFHGGMLPTTTTRVLRRVFALALLAPVVWYASMFS